MTLGEKLRAKREEQGLTIEKAALQTSIRLQFLQAIENDQMGGMASAAQARGFTRLYASFLGLDPRTLFDDEPAPAATASQAEVVPASAQPAEPVPAKKTTRKPKLAANPAIANPRARFKDLIPADTELKQSAAIFKEIGAELRAQRESLGLTLSDVERLTKIREIHLHNLEEGEVDRLPSTVQGRGILNNYSSFLSIDPAHLQNRFAEGLQQKRLETAAVELTSYDGKTAKPARTPITGWRRFLTMDLLVGTSVFVVLMVLVVWGAIQVIGSTQAKVAPTIESISDVLMHPDNETPSDLTPVAGTPQPTSSPSQAANTLPVDILATITSVNSGSIQLVVVGVQRTYVRVISDGREVFNGRVVPGTAYPFTGYTKILLTAGSASGIQVFYNQQDMGILGMSGEVLELEFTSKGFVTSTPMFTPSPTATQPPTLTQRATATPTATMPLPTTTITPLTTINP
jgi:cytoskeletal protein RodZ